MAKTKKSKDDEVLTTQNDDEVVDEAVVEEDTSVDEEVTGTDDGGVTDATPMTEQEAEAVRTVETEKSEAIAAGVDVTKPPQIAVLYGAIRFLAAKMLASDEVAEFRQMFPRLYEE